MKKLKKYYVVTDEYGNGVPGKTVVAYPSGTAIHGTTATDLGNGRYLFTIDPTGENLVISRLYDIKVNTVLYQSNVDLGQWEWYVRDLLVDASQIFNYVDLVDENGETLPTTIEEGYIVMTSKANRQGKVAFDNTTLTITLDSSGDDPDGLFDVWIKVIR